jgi:hypothetical protein
VEIDGLPVGDGKPGVLTRRLQERYIGICTGSAGDDRGWLTPGPLLDPSSADR